jgi:hypothetical protein
MTTRKSRTLLAMAFVAGTLPLTLTAQGQNNDAGSTCQVFGQVFGSDPLAGEMLVKTPAGTIETLLFDRTTSFTSVSFDAGSRAAPVPLAAATVNEGDWVCARTYDGVNAKRAASVLVATRREIQRQQRAALADWSSDSAFGIVIQLDPSGNRLVLECRRGGSTKTVFVNTSEKTRFHLWTSLESLEVSPASRVQVRAGDRIYVHGNFLADGNSLNASSVILGGVQAIAGTIGEIDPLDETVRLNELTTGETVMVHVNPGGPRLIAPAAASGPARVLNAIDFADIREGDSVMVLGRQDMSPGTKMNGLVLTVDFGEPTRRSLGGQVTWQLLPVTLGLP